MKEQVSRAKPSHPDQPSGEFNFAQVLQQQCLGVAAPAATAAEWPRGRGRGCPFWGRGRGCPFWGWGCPWGRGCPVLVVWSRAGSPRELALPGSVPGTFPCHCTATAGLARGSEGQPGSGSRPRAGRTLHHHSREGLQRHRSLLGEGSHRAEPGSCGPCGREKQCPGPEATSISPACKDGEHLQAIKAIPMPTQLSAPILGSFHLNPFPSFCFQSTSGVSVTDKPGKTVSGLGLPSNKTHPEAEGINQLPGRVSALSAGVDQCGVTHPRVEIWH